MDTFLLPIKFNRGDINKATDGTDEYYGHLLSCVIRTEPGELPLTPSFGCASPIFGTTEVSTLAIAAAKFIPEITIGGFRSDQLGSGESKIQLSFEQV